MVIPDVDSVVPENMGNESEEVLMKRISGLFTCRFSGYNFFDFNVYTIKIFDLHICHAP